MPHRRLWSHLRSPLTLRAVLLFAAVTMLLWLILDNVEQRRQRTERWQQLEAIMRTWPAVGESTRTHQQASDQITRNTEVLLEMSKGLGDIANILREDRSTRTAEHKELLSRVAAPAGTPRKRKSSPQNRPALRRCYREAERRTYYGETAVVEKYLTPTPCRAER